MLRISDVRNRTLAKAVQHTLLTLVLPFFIHSPAQSTFSICAVDTITGAVGSAGATCGPLAVIISRPAPGIGVVHTQAYWNRANQTAADALLRQGLTPDSIIAWLLTHDAENDGLDYRYRQYGIVTLDGPGASAAYTGTFTLYWQGHRTGPGYAIQGNVIMDSLVLTRMESAYLNTGGPLEDRLMAALQAAKYPGSDTRCATMDKSTITAFIRVAHPGDDNELYLEEIVSDTPESVDPIDVLQLQFDDWKAQQVADPILSSLEITPVAIPATGHDTATLTILPRNRMGIPPTHGAAVLVDNTGDGSCTEATDNGDGSFTACVVSPAVVGVDTLSAQVEAGGQIIQVAETQSVLYFRCGDTNNDDAVSSADIIYLVAHVFKGGGAPRPVMAVGDVDRSGTLTSADVIHLVRYVFKSGAPPCP